MDSTKNRLVDHWNPTGGVLYVSIVNGFIQYWGYSFTDEKVQLEEFSEIVMPEGIITTARGYHSIHKVIEKDIPKAEVTPLMFFKGSRLKLDSETMDFLDTVKENYNVTFSIHYCKEAITQSDLDILTNSGIKLYSSLSIDMPTPEELAENLEVMNQKYMVNVNNLLDWYVTTLYNHSKYVPTNYHAFYPVDEYWPQWEVKEQYFDAPFKFINPTVCEGVNSALCMARVDVEDDDDKVGDENDKEICGLINPRTTYEEDLEENLSLGSTGPSVNIWMVSSGGFPDWMSVPWGKTAFNSNGTILHYGTKDYSILGRKTLYDFHNLVIGTGHPDNEYPEITNMNNVEMFDKLWSPHISKNAKIGSDMFTVEDQHNFESIGEVFGKRIKDKRGPDRLKLFTKPPDGYYVKSKKLNIDGVVSWEFGLPNLGFVKKNKQIIDFRLYVSTSEGFKDSKRNISLRSTNILAIGSEFITASTDIGLNRLNDEETERVKDIYKEFPFAEKLKKLFPEDIEEIIKYSNHDVFGDDLNTSQLYVDWQSMVDAHYGEGIMSLGL